MMLRHLGDLAGWEEPVPPQTGGRCLERASEPPVNRPLMRRAADPEPTAPPHLRVRMAASLCDLAQASMTRGEVPSHRGFFSTL